jgi:transposase-like protein
MRINSKGRQTYTSEEIARWVSRYRASGLGLEHFAKEHGIASTRLHYWVYQRDRGRKPARPDSVPAVFQELKLANSLSGLQSWGAEISLPEGVAVRFSAAVSPVWIGSVVQALHRPC